MSTKVYFNRPLRPIDLRLLWADMKRTSDHLVLASAWFTDVDTAGVFIDSPAARKTVIFNSADMDRGTKRAYELIKGYFCNPVQWDENNPTQLFAGANTFKYGLPFEGGDISAAAFRFIVLGSGNWQEGVMHHKFILCDRVAWVGSFNFTHQARKNYETLLRIDDVEVVQDFYLEVEQLTNEPYVQNDDAIRNDVFRCQICGKMKHIDDLEHREHRGYGDPDVGFCKRCWEKHSRELAQFRQSLPPADPDMPF